MLEVNVVGDLNCNRVSHFNSRESKHGHSMTRSLDQTFELLWSTIVYMPFLHMFVGIVSPIIYLGHVQGFPLMHGVRREIGANNSGP